MLEQHRLDLGRRDVLAAGDDRVRLPAGDRQPRRARRSGRGRRCAASRRRSAPPAATIGPAHEDLAVRRDPQLDSRQRPAEGGDLRAGLGHAVGRRDRHAGVRAPAPAAPARSGRRRAAPSAASAGRCRPASSSRASIVGTSETSVIRRSGSDQRGEHRLGVEALVEHGGRWRRSRCGSGSRARRRGPAASGTASARPGRARAPPPSRARWPGSCRR